MLVSSRSDDRQWCANGNARRYGRQRMNDNEIKYRLRKMEDRQIDTEATLGAIQTVLALLGVVYLVQSVVTVWLLMR